jgi:hypothetical protein
MTILMVIMKPLELHLQLLALLGFYRSFSINLEMNLVIGVLVHQMNEVVISSMELRRMNLRSQ